MFSHIKPTAFQRYELSVKFSFSSHLLSSGNFSLFVIDDYSTFGLSVTLQLRGKQLSVHGLDHEVHPVIQPRLTDDVTQSKMLRIYGFPIGSWASARNV